MQIPKRGRGRPKKGATFKYWRDMIKFTSELKQEQKKLDFKVGTRGWCYRLEGENLITKGEFNDAVNVITIARKAGLLPVDFSAIDPKRVAKNVVYFDGSSISAELEKWEDAMLESVDKYSPTLLKEDTNVYFEVMVEKSDLVGLFLPICKKYQIPITNIGGQPDINSRVAMMRRCKRERDSGRKVILLYCGDHDPSGLVIARTLKGNLKALQRATDVDPSFIELDIFGLTYEYIVEHELLWVDNLETGNKELNKRGIGLDHPKHPDHQKKYVQEYIKKYGARKVEANALMKDVKAARRLLEDTILKYISSYALYDYEKSLIDTRAELKKAVEKIWE